jgi:hypothetical protein
MKMKEGSSLHWEKQKDIRRKLFRDKEKKKKGGTKQRLEFLLLLFVYPHDLIIIYIPYQRRSGHIEISYVYIIYRTKRRKSPNI